MKIDLALLKRIHENISRESTGSPGCFSEKLGISKRFLHEILEYLKSELNAPIEYSRSRMTYYYSEDWELYVGNLFHIKSELIKGVLETINRTVKIVLVVVWMF
jgi:hypothetical protein